jgi:very-short-patch-repair endonuclease
MPQDSMMKYNRSYKLLSRKLRSEMTKPEILLWARLRSKQILGVQFYRQKPLFNYIVDFYAHRCRLVIECDGSQHYEDNNSNKDHLRDEALNANGIHVLRFANNEIINDIDSVVEKIWYVAKDRIKV